MSIRAARPSVKVIVGARQVGKSTLSRVQAPHLPYFNLDAPEIREALEAIAASLWARDVGPAILDECQKLPSVLEKVKFAWDEGGIGETLLTGSSQILLLQKVRESLAGRVSLHECWPMTLSELAVKAAGDPPPVPLLDALLRAQGNLETLLEAQPMRLVGVEDSVRRSAEDYLLRWGGMPALLHLEESHREDWLRDYVRTFLERDLADLARLHDLECEIRRKRPVNSGQSGRVPWWSESLQGTR